MSTALLLEATKTFHRKLLDKARNSLRSSQREMAVVISQAASEMCTEWALTVLLQIRGDQDLVEPMLGLFLVRDICNERLRRIYTALSGDNLQKVTFWTGLKRHHDRRNGIVHKVARCTDDEARESLDVVRQYIRHVENVLDDLQRRREKAEKAEKA